MGLGALDSLPAIIASAEPSAGSCSVVAIDGRAGAGKSTLAAELAEALQAPVFSRNTP